MKRRWRHYIPMTRSSQNFQTKIAQSYSEHSPNLQFITINPSKSLPLTHVRYWYLMVYASSVSTNIASWNFGPIFTFYLIKQNYDHMTNHVFCFDFNWLVNIGTIHTVTPISKMVSFNEIRNGLQLTTCY